MHLKNLNFDKFLVTIKKLDLEYDNHHCKKIDDNNITNIPWLKYFLVAQFHFTQIFEAAQKDFHNTDL